MEIEIQIQLTLGNRAVILRDRGDLADANSCDIDIVGEGIAAAARRGLDLT